MRFATACLALLLVPAASAQAPPPEAFYPLDVGNEWVYTFQFSGPRFLQHDRIVGTETIGGVAYTLRERCAVPVTSDGPGTPDCELQRIRFDDRDLVVRHPDGSERAEACAVGAPTGTLAPCDEVVGPDFTLEVVQGGPTTVVVGQHAVDVDGVQSYDTVQCCMDPPPAGFALGLGRLAHAVFGDVARFEYARVGDREVGVNPLDPDPASFAPLAAGTVREYIEPFTSSIHGPAREDDVRTVVLDGQTWTLQRRQIRGPEYGLGVYTRTETRDLFRYDDATGQVLRRLADGSGTPHYLCGFDVPVGESDCEGIDVFKELLSSVTVGDESRTAATITYSLFGTATFAAGLGMVFSQGELALGVPVRYIDVGPLPTGDPLPFGTSFGEVFPTEPDPTPAHRYFPLSVGDEWHYQFSTVSDPNGYRRYRIVGAEVVGGETYVSREFSTARPGDDVPTWDAVWTELIRYDSLSAQVVRPDGEAVFPCPLDEPVNLDPDNVVLCGRLLDDGQDDTAAFRTSAGAVVQQGGLVVPTESYKTFRYVGGEVDFSTSGGLAAGVGLVYEPGTATTYAALEYARVQQDDGSVLELGAPLVVDADAAPVGTRLGVTASPNPTAGPLWLAFTTPTAAEATVEIVDALGRRVRFDRRRLPAGTTELGPYDTRGWAPGLYVVRLRVGDAVATARVVRR